MFSSWPCDWLQVLLFLLLTPTTKFSLDHKRRSCKCFDSFDSNYVELMTLLTTPIFDFH